MKISDLPGETIEKRLYDHGMLNPLTMHLWGIRNNGLDWLIRKEEWPHADQNAQDDIEGRPRRTRSYGKIERSVPNLWGIR